MDEGEQCAVIDDSYVTPVHLLKIIDPKGYQVVGHRLQYTAGSFLHIIIGLNIFFFYIERVLAKGQQKTLK